MKIATLIPIYAHPKRGAEIARRLADEDLEGSEVFIAVDGETNAEIAAALEEVRELDGVHVIEGRPHLGKAETLNRAVAEIDAEFLLFLDNDIEIPAGASLLADCVKLLGTCDIAELPKVGRGKGPIANMVTYEFLSNIVATEFIVGKAGRIPSLNGAAFAIRKELFARLGGFRAVVNEDTDLAGRAFFLGARFGFDPAMTVNNEVPERIGVWLKQRRRWAINTALWATIHLERVLKNAPEIRPTLAASSVIFPLPTLALVAGVFLPLIPASMLKASGLGTLFLCLGGVLLCFGPTALFFARKSKEYSSSFAIPSFIAFSAFYLPIWGLASMLGMINVATGNLPELDWKHDRNQDLENLRIASELKDRDKDKGRKRKAYSPR